MRSAMRLYGVACRYVLISDDPLSPHHPILTVEAAPAAQLRAHRTRYMLLFKKRQLPTVYPQLRGHTASLGCQCLVSAYLCSLRLRLFCCCASQRTVADIWNSNSLEKTIKQSCLPIRFDFRSQCSSPKTEHLRPSHSPILVK
jgi:hypothetical protein